MVSEDRVFKLRVFAAASVYRVHQFSRASLSARKNHHKFMWLRSFFILASDLLLQRLIFLCASK